jgi:hypothetical protein
MSEQGLDELVAAAIGSKPQLKSSIERMFDAIKKLDDRNATLAFRKYLEKIKRSDDAEAARFATEMERYAIGTEQVLATLETGQSPDVDAEAVIYSHFPQARKVVAGILFAFACLAALIIYLVAYRG